LEVQADSKKKIAGRGISHLSKYTVSLFILVPSSHVKLFNSSLVWRMYCRQCRGNNNGQTAQDSIAVATSTVVLNWTTMWQLQVETRGYHATVSTRNFAKIKVT